MKLFKIKKFTYHNRRINKDFFKYEAQKFTEKFEFKNIHKNNNNFEYKYTKTLYTLFEVNKFVPKKVNLDNIIRACNLIGNPEKNLKFIHVTGTNGKGSVCKKIAIFFENFGLKTGLYISPHISTFRERIQINSKNIEKEYIVEICDFLFNLNNKFYLNLTYFEYVTLICFIYFREKKIDIGIIEVGLGGNLDSTNIINPLLSIITSIGLDHLDTLGYTQKEIAEKKAGIIKNNVPVIIGQDCFPREVFIEEALKKQSELFIMGNKIINNKDFKDNNLINYVNIENSQVELINDFKENLMDFDLENKLIALCAIEYILKKDFFNLFSNNKSKELNDIIKIALKTKQNCRMEDVFDVLGRNEVEKNINILWKNILKYLNNKLSENKEKYQIFPNIDDNNIFKINLTTNKIHKIYLDVGHNSHGIEKLLFSIRMNNPSCFIRTIVGFSYGKDHRETIKSLCNFSDKIYLCSAKSSRALNYIELIKMVNDYRKISSVGNSIFSNFDEIIEFSKKIYKWSDNNNIKVISQGIF